MWEELEKYMAYLEQEERSESTRKQYRRALEDFLKMQTEGSLSREAVLEYKRKLVDEYQPASVNVRLAALNGFFYYLGRTDLRVKFLKIQRKAYCSEQEELKKEEYLRLAKTAEKKGDRKLGLLIQTLASTGIRVSELAYITVEAVKQGEAHIRLKGKNRTALLPGRLLKKLRDYIEENQMTHGPVFATRSGKALDRSNIWKKIKKLSEEAGVDRRKAFPHNLRHLFARTFYGMNKDIAKLADILGHSSINTTRIYITSTGQEHLRYLDSMDLVV